MKSIKDLLKETINDESLSVENKKKKIKAIHGIKEMDRLNKEMEDSLKERNKK